MDRSSAQSRDRFGHPRTIESIRKRYGQQYGCEQGSDRPGGSSEQISSDPIYVVGAVSVEMLREEVSCCDGSSVTIPVMLCM